MMLPKFSLQLFSKASMILSSAKKTPAVRSLGLFVCESIIIQVALRPGHVSYILVGCVYVYVRRVRKREFIGLFVYMGVVEGVILGFRGRDLVVEVR